MSGWTVPLSSSPPSTPGSRQPYTSRNGGVSGSFASHPSTTPAGPPPSSARSFTPADPPPSAIFGSSQLGSGNTLFKSKSSPGNNTGSRRDPKNLSSTTVYPKKQPRTLEDETPFMSFMSTKNNGPRDGALRAKTFNVPSSSPPSGMADEDEGESRFEDNAYGESYSEESEEGGMHIDSDEENQPIEAPSMTSSRLSSSIASGVGTDWAPFGSSLGDGTPRGFKRSRGGVVIANGSSRHNVEKRIPKKDSAIPSIAKNMATQLGVANLDDPDDLILGTEDLVGQLYLPETIADEQDIALETTLPTVSEDLNKLWESCRHRSAAASTSEEEVTIGIGPADTAPHFHKAIFLGSLLLQLHHPPAAKGKQALAVPRSFSLDSSTFHPSKLPPKPTAIPKLLVDWLHDYHNPYRTATIDLRTFNPNPTAHVNFWDIIFSSTLRGNISEVIGILKKSDFKYARTAREDGQGQGGYILSQIDNIKKAISQTVQVLESCPSLLDGNWKTTGNEWLTFRRRVEQAKAALTTFAEGRDRDSDSAGSTFEAPNFGIRSSIRGQGLSQSARRAESRVPWTIYQNLKAMYGIMLGGTNEIVSSAQDWVEATVGLTAWWDGDDDDDEVAVGSLAKTRRSLRHSQSRGGRLVDLNASAAYLRRLAFAFERVTDDTDEDLFQINPMNPVEVGLASIFEGNVEGVVGLLQSWSLPVASAVVEIASIGGWFESCLGDGMRNGFDESDLLVLSYGQEKQGISRDGILVEYAEELFDKGEIQGQGKKEAKEGWEMSLQILARLEDTSVANKKVVELLGDLPLESDKRVDKILDICQGFGLEKEACTIAERYADWLTEISDRYGTALIYYARSHRLKKVRDVLNLLVSLSLVHSIAFPPQSALDQNLHALVNFPKQTLEELANIDTHAAEMLYTHLTGYATLRRFYDLRDEEVNLSKGEKPKLRPLARKKETVAALIAVINSAADNIHGGLYDPERGSVVQVDGLLTLLGEAMIFVDQPKRALSNPQTFALLAAIEDLQTVAPSIYIQCEECFRATLSAAYGTKQPPDPKALLKKSISSMTASGSFSLVGSEMLRESMAESGSTDGKVGDTDVKDVKRGWDWRTGLGKDTSGDDILRILRLGLAKEVATGWFE